MADSYGVVAVESAFDLSYSDLAPLLDELSKRHVTVRASVVNYGRPAAGAAEMFLLILVAGSLIYLKSFLQTWAVEDAKALREKLFTTLQLGSGSQRPHGMYPMRLEIGGVRFYFRKPLSDDEFLKRLRAAQEYVESLPDEVLASRNGPGAHGMYWDQEAEAWKLVVSGWAGDICPFDAG